MTTFDKWYEKNKDKVSERRKKRYEQDDEYREKRLAEARRHYWLKKRRAQPISLEPVDKEEFPPDDTLTIVITHPKDIRKGMAVEVPVYRPGTVARLVKRSVQTIRLWGLKGYIPEVLYRAPGGARLYTKDQFDVIADAKPLMAFPTKNFEDSPFFTEVKLGWASLEPDGIQPLLEDEWRFDPTQCPWCGKTPSLQYKDSETGKWENVPCFECSDPVAVEERTNLQKETVFVKGRCSWCDTLFDEKIVLIKDVDDELRVRCPRCGRDVEDFEAW